MQYGDRNYSQNSSREGSEHGSIDSSTLYVSSMEAQDLENERNSMRLKFRAVGGNFAQFSVLY